MQRQELIDIFEETFDKCLKVMKAKNHDYAGKGDALKNFKLVDYLDIADTAQGVLVRMSDKFSRLSNVYRGDTAVAETVEDTIEDLINYAVILKACLREQNEDYWDKIEKQEKEQSG